ncbi:MAG: ankyrin repeat domain-containing protein [Anaerohalosphaeraceae bacterium]
MKTQACIVGVLFVFLGVVRGDNVSATQNLIQACKANQILQIQKYIQDGADVNAANAQGILPLYYAVRNANSQAVELLIDTGAKVDAFSAGEGAEFKDVTMPVLMWAASMKKNEMASLLISGGASVDIADSSRRHLLCIAVESNNTELLDMLVQKGESLNGRYLIGPKKCGSLLHIAVDMGSTSMLNYLLEKDIDIELRDELGRSPLISAVENNNLEMVKMLIAKGAYLYATPGYGGTLLERDSGQVSPLILNYIHKSDREAKERIQPAAWAAFLVRDGFAPKLDWKQLQEHLLQGGGIKGTDLDNNALLHYAAASTEYPLEQLISGGLDVHAVNNHGETPLHWAVRYDRVENVKYLLEHGADVHARDKSGNTPLNTMANYFMNRASGEKREVVITQMLLEYGADINARNSFGKAALASVSEERMEDCIDLIKLLIEKGADVNLRTDKGGTALHIAAELGNPKTVQLLLEAGASVAIYDIYERNPLDAARYDQEQKIALMFPYKKDACIIDAVYYDQIG